jgi:anti-sigma factor RsiW
MNCQEIKKLLVPFLESELSESDKLIVEAHLQTCADCQKDKILLEKTWSILDRYAAPKISSNFTANLMSRIHDQGEAKPKFALPEINIQFSFRVLVPVMVSACVLIVIYLFVQNQLVSQQQIAKVVLPEQKTITQVQENAPAESKVNVAEVTPSEQKEDIKVAAKVSVPDEEIIRNLDVYTNIELYQNYALVSDLDVVQNLGAKVM